MQMTTQLVKLPKKCVSNESIKNYNFWTKPSLFKLRIKKTSHGFFFTRKLIKIIYSLI